MAAVSCAAPVRQHILSETFLPSRLEKQFLNKLFINVIVVVVESVRLQRPSILS